jgi:vacuolar protein sorting-associated protein 18
VNASLADTYFADAKYILAAQCYAQSSRSFEEVVLAFGDVEERDALRYFLAARLERLNRNVSIFPLFNSGTIFI